MIWLAVALGGAIGAMGRYAVTILLPHQAEQFPWATFTVNVLGSISIGVCYVLLIEKGIAEDYWRPFLMVGLLGALTTFSTFSLDTILLWQEGQAGLAIIYIMASLIFCTSSVVASIYLAQKIF